MRRHPASRNSRSPAGASFAAVTKMVKLIVQSRLMLDSQIGRVAKPHHLTNSSEHR
jgi:hypothetical protein